VKSTAVNALPYPEATDPPDGPSQFKGLAEALDVLGWGSRNLKPTIGVKQAAATLLELETAGFQDIALAGGDLVLTPDVNSQLLVLATFDLMAGTGNNTAPGANIAEAIGTIRLNSEDQGRCAEVKVQREGPMYRIENRVTATQFYSLALNAATKYTIKMRAKRVELGGTGGKGACYATNTGLLYVLFAR
jgi:hypothetical protein